MADALKRKGAIVQRGYHCKGKAGFFNLGHPNREDLDGARKFARDMVQGWLKKMRIPKIVKVAGIVIIVVVDSDFGFFDHYLDGRIERLRHGL